MCFVDSMESSSIADSGTTQVRIGTETGAEGFSTMALVASNYGGSALGTLGPTRMDYPGTMAAVAAVARYVGRLLNED